MKGLLFFVGGALIAIAMGAPEGLPTHSGSAKSALPYLAYWLLSPFQDWGGKYFVVAIGTALLALSFILPKKPKSPPRK
jgi:hypothetical protein